MLIDIQEKDGSIIFTIDGEAIEFTEADLQSFGMNSNDLSEILKAESLELQ